MAFYLVINFLVGYRRRQKLEQTVDTVIPPISIEASEILAPSMSSRDHIYEEISDLQSLGDTYDHLQHDPCPIPIPTDNHYHNFLLLERQSRINQ